MTRSISAAACVNIGKRRENNEDNLYFNGIYLTEENREKPAAFQHINTGGRQLYAVFDGMGGEEMGELASLVTAQTLHKYRVSFNKNINGTMANFISEANGLVCEAQMRNGNKRIGTTLALLLAAGGTAHVCNIGDSRVYLLRKGILKQMTEDHTPVARSIRAGVLTPEQARKHPQRNSLSQFIGIDPVEMVIQPYQLQFKLKNGDIFLLCSDGLTDTVEEPDICRILQAADDPAQAAAALVDAALAGGGKDNVTVITLAYSQNWWRQGR